MNKKLNNKGFTLIELLAVFVILLSISFVAVGGIMSSLDKRNKKECVEQHEMAISAAKMYFSLDGKKQTEVSIDTLKNKGYIEKKSDLLNKNKDENSKYSICFDSSHYYFCKKNDSNQYVELGINENPKIDSIEYICKNID